MSGGGYYGGKYFPDGYFPERYFGTEGTADPNAMAGSAAGSATVSGTLSSEGVAVQPARGGAAYFTPKELARLRAKRRKWKQDEKEFRDELKDIYAQVTGSKPVAKVVAEARKADLVDAPQAVAKVLSALSQNAHVAGLLSVQAQARKLRDRLKAMEAERAAMAEAEDEEDLIMILMLTG
jgi:hypothetical protein